jgi:hypothetical protein
MVHGFRRLAVAVASAVVMASTFAAAGGGSAAAATPPGWRIAQLYPEHSQALEVTAAGPANAWVVEDCGAPCRTSSGQLTLRHWNGKGWQVVANPPALRNTHGDMPLLAMAPGATSTPWAVLGSDPSGKNRGAVAVRRTGSSWAAPHWFANAFISTVVAPTQNSAWVFGESKTSPSYAQRWNGRIWSAAPAPKIFVVSASARSATDIWVTGVRPALNASAAMVVSHWNGVGWTTRALPRIAVPAGDLVQPLSIAVSGARDAWALGFISKPGQLEPNDGLAMFHWNGSAWSAVTVPYKETIAYSVAGDLHGGVWLWAHLTPGQDHMIHVTASGQWSEFTVPRPAGAFAVQADAVAAIPGTSSVWASGWASYHAGTQGIVLKYGA